MCIGTRPGQSGSRNSIIKAVTDEKTATMTKRTVDIVVAVATRFTKTGNETVNATYIK